MATETVGLQRSEAGSFGRIGRTLRGVHASLGGWYWVVLVGLTMISLHTFDHAMAVVNNTSPFAQTFISDDNTEGFIIWHGGLTVLDYTMSIVLLTLVYIRWPEPLPIRNGRLLPSPLRSMRRLHKTLGRSYWFVLGALSIISFHTFDHLAAIVWNTSPLSDTFVANSVSHEGFLVWHSSLTILDYAMTLWLIHLVYSRWRNDRGVGSMRSPPEPVAAAGESR